jgi:predicted MFS family arabinose efflux permease
MTRDALPNLASISPEPAAQVRPGSGSRRGWPGVAAAGLATFSVVTTEMLPVGLLLPIADSLDMSAGMGGLMLSVPAIVAAVCAPLVVVGAGRVDRRRLLCGLVALLACANLASALAPGMAAFLAARILVGVCIGGIWALAGGLASRLVPPAAVGLATAVIFGGVAAASVLGVPLGAFVGGLGGWRAAFGAMAALCLGVLVLMRLTLPPLPVAAPLPARQLVAQLAIPRLRHGLLIALFLVAGHFMAYTYVRPLLESVAGFGAAWIGPLLFAYGVAGVAGNFVAGSAASRHAGGALFAIVLGLMLILSIFSGLASLRAAALPLLLVWGFAYGGVSVSLQTWMMRAAPAAVEAATALLVAIFNLGIALGSLAGVPSVDLLGVPATLLLGAACMAPAALMLAAGARRLR